MRNFLSSCYHPNLIQCTYIGGESAMYTKYRTIYDLKVRKEKLATSLCKKRENENECYCCEVQVIKDRAAGFPNVRISILLLTFV